MKVVSQRCAFDEQYIYTVTVWDDGKTIYSRDHVVNRYRIDDGALIESEDIPAYLVPILRNWTTVVPKKETES